MQKKLIYQVLPRLWKNGKFSDWDKESFRYLRSLSIDYVWYTGVIRHASGEPWVKGNPGSPYAISDYYDVNPYLADNEEKRMEEFAALVQRTHEAGIKVLIDFVPNHVAKGGASDIPTFSHCDYDWTDTVKINYGHPDTWKKMLDIVLFWANLGVDGIRCDMAELVPQDFWAWMSAEVKKKHPKFILVGEVYNRFNYTPFLNYCGFDLLYDKSGLYDSLRAVMCNGMTARCITWNWQSLGDMQGNMLNFLENHDEQRLASSHFLGRASKSYAALAVSALFNQASFMLYCGQECGESAPESDNGRTSLFDIVDIKSLKNPDEDVLARYRETLKLASGIIFRRGSNWDLCYCNSNSMGFNPDRHFAFLRYIEGKGVVVACNFSDTDARMDIIIPKETGFGLRTVRLNVPAWDYSTINITQ